MQAVKLISESKGRLIVAGVGKSANISSKLVATFNSTVMNISKNEVDALNLLVNIEITPEDYQTKVSNVLENYRKRANIPGFRPGKVPMGLIKKQYGKAVLIEEINNLLQDNIYKYITDEKLNILGNPMPIEQPELDFDTAGSYNFQFELGLSPEFEISISKKNKVKAVKVVADKTVIGAGTTNESGSVSISIPTYGGQTVTIEVYHSLYKTDKLADIKLENAKAYSFNLAAKGDSAEEITKDSEATIAKTQEQIEKEKEKAGGDRMMQ